MSPHNYSRFNGNNINSKSSYHSDQHALAVAFGNGMSRVYKGLSIVTGVYFFNNVRLFNRGIQQLDTASLFKAPR